MDQEEAALEAVLTEEDLAAVAASEEVRSAAEDLVEDLADLIMDTAVGTADVVTAEWVAAALADFSEC